MKWILILLFSACTGIEVPKQMEPPIPPIIDVKDPGPLYILPAWENGMAERVAWTGFVKEAIVMHGNGLLNSRPGDIDEYARNYSQDQDYRLNFWAYLISHMAKWESNYDPKHFYTERFPDSRGVRVVSRGLLQISIESGNGYGCGFKTAQDLHDPRQNLICAVKILNKWVPKDGFISKDKKGGARYWSVIRSGNMNGKTDTSQAIKKEVKLRY